MTFFSAHLVKQAVDETGKPFAVLNETAFYPTGGGQPHDTGHINGVPVVDVEEVDGEIRHYIERLIPSDEKEQLHGVIDWTRRFDHMQQHMGQHILSAAFEELFGIQTVSFHLGAETVTIDLETEELQEEIIEAAERRANEVIRENHPVETTWLTLEEALRYPLRKKPLVKENIRLVIIPEFDYNGCGGTHPKSTGEVMAIKLLGWERQRKRVRLEFVCGNRVLHQLGQKQSILRELMPLLNSPQERLYEAAQRLVEEKKQLERTLEEAEEKLLELEAEGLVQQSELIGNRLVIRKSYRDRPIQKLQKLAGLTIERIPGAFVVFAVENGDRLQLVAAKGREAEGDLREAAKQVFPLIEGKGGGRPDLIQGGGKRLISPEKLADTLLKALS